MKPLRQRVIKALLGFVDDATIAGIIAIMFTVALLSLSVAFAWVFIRYNDPTAIDGIKTVWATLGTPYGLILGYYFKQ